MGAEMLLKRNPTYHAPADYLINPSVEFNAKSALDSLVVNVKDPQRYKYGLAGMLISASKRIPVVNIIARPVDSGLKRLTKGKWGI